MGLGLTAAVIVLMVGTMLLVRRLLENNMTTVTIQTGPSYDESILSVQDKEMAERTEEVVIDRFGEDPVATFQAMQPTARANEVEAFARDLIDLYDLDADVEICTLPKGLMGYYSYDQKLLRVDVSGLLFDFTLLPAENRLEAMTFVVKETLDTVVHELRHAVQYKAIEVDNDRYWGIDEQRRIEWAANIVDYIEDPTDPRGYFEQPIEKDCFTFADEALKGVFNYE